MKGCCHSTELIQIIWRTYFWVIILFWKILLICNEAHVLVCCGEVAAELQKGAQWRKVASRGDGTTDADVICQAEGVPRVEFSWAKNGIPLNFGSPR